MKCWEALAYAINQIWHSVILHFIHCSCLKKRWEMVHEKKKDFFLCQIYIFFPKITEACLNFRFQFVTLYQNSWRDCSIPWKTIIESFKNHKNTITAFTKNVSLETKPMGTSTLDQVRKKGYFLKDRFREWKKVFKHYCSLTTAK